MDKELLKIYNNYKDHERAEMESIGGRNQPGKLVALSGDPQKGTTVTIHGINADPSSVEPLGKSARKRGEALQTFAWDDKSRRLEDSANDFADSVKGILDKNPQAPLTINAHSMGGLVAAVGLSRLEKLGELRGKDVRLNLIAPPLQGFESANMARFGGALIPNLRSSVDMGTNSRFQNEVEEASFGDHVKVNVFGASNDKTAVVNDGWTQIARNLAGGKEPTILKAADHNSVVERAAGLLSPKAPKKSGLEFEGPQM